MRLSLYHSRPWFGIIDRWLAAAVRSTEPQIGRVELTDLHQPAPVEDLHDPVGYRHQSIFAQGFDRPVNVHGRQP